MTPPETTDERNARIHGRSGRIVEAIERFNRELSPEARREKYGKMAESAYALYRGTNHLFWMDFEWDWRLTRFGSFRTRTWLNGDCHAYNFGAYDVREKGVIYGLNDFDEAIVADYQYDLWRLAVSLVLIARENEDLRTGAQEEVIDGLSESYLDTLRRFAGNRKARKRYYNSKKTRGQLRGFLRELEKERSRGELLDEWTETVDGRTRFDRASEKIAEAPAEDAERIALAFPGYLRTIARRESFCENFFRIKDVAVRLGAGTGSLGTARYYVLIEGDKAKGHDDVILDVKRQGRPSAYPYASRDQRREYRKRFPNEGIRHAEAYRALGYRPDELLGWLELDDGVFSVRERSPYKEAFPTKKLDSKRRFARMARHWGRGLATEHARACEITDYELAREVGKLTDGKGKRRRFGHVVREVAFGYADVVEADWEAFKKHLAPGDGD